MRRLPRSIVIMGVSGSGKSLIGRILTVKLNAVFEDADDFHSAANKAKMSAGIPLTDDDRLPWYRILRERIMAHRSAGIFYVLACSALKRSYRAILRGEDGPEVVTFVYLKGSHELINARTTARQGHFMPPALLDCQFTTLEEPCDAIVIDVALSPDEMVRIIMEHFC